MKPTDLPEQIDVACQPEHHLLYAALLSRCTWVGTVMLLVSFTAEILGLLPTHVAHARLPALWSLPSKQYAVLADWPRGWGWLWMASQGDLANLLGIATLCASSAVCVLAVLPYYVRRGDRAYVGICLGVLAMLFVAASGWMEPRH